jgi:predicted phage terminase large subunit-like protein
MMMSTREYVSILRNDLTSFIERTFCELNPQTRLILGPHIEVLATKLEAVRRGECKRLIVNIPPRHLKSIAVSVAFPAWLLGHDPSKKIVCASYGQELAEKLARDCRTVMTSDWYQQLFATRLSDRQAVHDFETTANGGRMSGSVGGPLTGRGGDLLIIDDPVKPDEAMSDTKRGAANDWYDGTLLSRLNDKKNGAIIIVMQRLHQDDLVGHVLEQEEWDVVSFPAIAEDDQSFPIESPLGMRTFYRKAGDPLQPERQDLQTLANIRKTMGEYHFLSQYQQSPQPKEGAIVKTAWLRYYEPHEKPAHFDRIVQSWDTANKSGELNDYSVCTTWGVSNRVFYLLDVYRQRVNYPDLKRAVLALNDRYSPETILIEDKASGTSLVQDLINEGYRNVLAYKPPAGNDKAMRLHAQCALIENGAVRFPKSADWLADYINELISFPGAKHDDQVDSTTQALDHCKVPSSLEVWAKLGEGPPLLPMYRHFGL